MSSIVIAGDTSGSVTLSAPAVAGTTVLTLPAVTDTLVGKTTPSFTTTIGVGNATPSASGAGITFPATQSASTDANTLDDYEEGTWTPNQGAGLTVVGTFGSSGSYTKVGRLVTVIGLVTGSTSIASSAGNAICSNLPFASASGTVGGVADANGGGGGGGQIQMNNAFAGVTNPNKFLRVNDSGYFDIVNSAYSALIMSVTDAGVATQGNNSAAWTVASDIRLKTNVRQLNSALGKIIEWNGKRQTRSQWERELGMRPTTLRGRIRAGWTMEKAMQPLAWLAEGNTPEEA